MLAWETIDSCALPEGAAMQLMRHGQDWEIRIDGHVLMSSREHGSEDALADLACRPIVARKKARVLVGGLGMGFTLARALSYLADDAEVTVAELVPEILAWHQSHLADVAGGPLTDPRTRVEPTDVAELLRHSSGIWDAIMIDVDNGPTGMTAETNNWLYSLEGLAVTHNALKADGVLSIWSASADKGFLQRMKRAGFEVKQHKVRSRGVLGGRRHVIWVGVPRPERVGKG